MCNNKLELVCSRPNLCVVLHVKQMIWRVKCFILFFIYPRRLYFKSLSSGETDKEKYFLVLQVSFTFIYFFSSMEEFFHIYLFLYGLAVWEGFVIPGFSGVSDPDFFKRSGFPGAYLNPNQSISGPLFVTQSCTLVYGWLANYEDNPGESWGRGTWDIPALHLRGRLGERGGVGVSQYYDPFLVLETGLEELCNKF